MNAEYKATKIQKGSKTFVIVTDPRGNEVARMGGHRARRAAAVFLTTTKFTWTGDGNDTHFKVDIESGCRKDYESAVAAINSPERDARVVREFFDGHQWVPAIGCRESYAIRID